MKRGFDPSVQCVALLVLASVLLCAPLFLNLRNGGRADWDQFTFRYETPRVALLRDRVLPVWNPYANGGTALLAHPDSPVLSPWYGIVLALGAPLGLRVQVVFFMALGAIGMAALAGRLGASRAGALAGGLVFMMSSHFVLHVTEGHMEWCVLGLMPWLAMLAHRLRDPSPRRVVGAALLLASILLFGAVYIPAVFMPFLTVWLLLESARARNPGWFARWILVAGLAALLAAVKLLPMISFTSDWPKEVRADQRTPAGVLLTGLLDSRQAFLYLAGRDRNLPDGHFAKAVPDAEAEPVLRSLAHAGAVEGFHEYGAYMGRVGLVLAALGLLRTGRRFWPLYVTGGLAVVAILGSAAPLNLWGAMRQLPLYHQLQVPSRFLAALLFGLSIAVAFGLTAIGELIERQARTLRRPVEAALALGLFASLASTAWPLFSTVFTIPPPPLEAHRDFAHRVTRQSLYPALTQSTMFPALLANSGVLEAYENVAVARAAVLTPEDPGYRGEAFLEAGPGEARVRRWTMSKVVVAVRADQPDHVILNQNFYRGWRASIRNASGRVETIPARPRLGGVLSVPVPAGDSEVEIFYRPAGLTAGAVVSALAAAACLVALLRPGRGALVT